tara:strand:- start:49 stop:255 length:207 start_codon:yes stop_codon:yes gene_type:complete
VEREETSIPLIQKPDFFLGGGNSAVLYLSKNPIPIPSNQTIKKIPNKKGNKPENPSKAPNATEVTKYS